MSTRALSLLLLLSAAILHTASAQADDALHDVDRSTQHDATKGPTHVQRQNADDDDDEAPVAHDDDGGAWLLVFAPFVLPRMFDDAHLVGYERYPRAGHGGLAARAQGSDVRPVALQTDMETGYALQGVVPATFALRLQLPARFELSARTSLLSDVLADSPTHASATTALVSYRFAQSAHAEFRAGLGMRQFRLGDARFGFDAMYAIDFFARHGITSRIELHVGSLDRAAVLEARGTLGVLLGPVELYAGGTITAFVGSDTSSRLGGPIAGVRVWL
jgi:hypothetical protein